MTFEDLDPLLKNAVSIQCEKHIDRGGEKDMRYAASIAHAVQNQLSAQLRDSDIKTAIAVYWDRRNWLKKHVWGGVGSGGTQPKQGIVLDEIIFPHTLLEHILTWVASVETQMEADIAKRGMKGKMTTHLSSFSFLQNDSMSHELLDFSACLLKVIL